MQSEKNRYMIDTLSLGTCLINTARHYYFWEYQTKC